MKFPFYHFLPTRQMKSIMTTFAEKLQDVKDVFQCLLILFFKFNFSADNTELKLCKNVRHFEMILQSFDYNVRF